MDRRLLIAAVAACGAVLLALTSTGSGPIAASPTMLVLSPSPAVTMSQPTTVVALGTPSEPARLSFAVPVSGGVVPTDPMLLPGSPRSYRGGFHEGVDFPARVGTPVYAAAAGTVTRIDYAYQEWSEPAKNAALDNARRLGYTPEIVLDLIRGRQVWVDHGGGVVTRYAHLSSVASLQRGDLVNTTTAIGAVGSSGYPEGGPHLHFEIRIGDSYLGAGLDVAEVRAAVANAFDLGSVAAR